MQLYQSIRLLNRSNFVIYCQGRRYFSGKHDQVAVRQGGSVHIQAQQSPSCIITLTSGWTDHCDVEITDNCHLLVDELSNSLTINTKYSESTSKIALKVPELIDVHINGNQLHIQTNNQIKGSMTVNATSGTIEIDKIKGAFISLQIGKGDLIIKRLLEGSKAMIQCRDMTAKMVHCENISVNASEKSCIEALYASKSSIQAENGVKIDMIRGSSTVTTKVGDIFMKGIDGSFNVATENGRIELQINKLPSGSISQAKAANGNVFVRADPKIHSLLECQTVNESSSANRSSITITSPSFEKHMDTTLDNEKLTSLRGILRGSDDHLNKKNQSGKINVQEAENQSLDEKESIRDKPSSLTLISNAHIRVETVSWIDMIRLKHGLEVSTPASSQSRIGRTGRASLAARELVKGLTSE